MIEAYCSLQTYRSYLPSGADYFEAAPAHWLVVPGMLALTENRRDNKGMKESQVPSLSYGRIIIKAEEKLVGLVPESFETYQLAMPGDIIIRCTDLQNDQASLRTAFVKDRGIITSAYLCLGVREGFQNRYIHYLLHLLDISKAIYKLGSGLRQNLSFDDFKRLPVLKPSYEEQLLIADYLDQKFAQIDQAIQIKERQIERLKERKQILIQQAVTLGLNRDAPMRDSDIDWLGEIPAHWSVMANRALFRERVEPGREDLPLLSVSIHSGVSKEEISEEENIRGRVKIEDKTKYIRVRPGDIAFNMMRAWQGAIGAVRVEGMVSPAYTIAAPRPSLDARYFEYQYRTPGFIQQMDRYSKGITDFRKRLYWDGFKQLITLVPPIEEQRTIVEFIEQAMLKQNAAVALLEQQITKLKEYKATLINSAVTGKIKVPGVVEPAEIQEREFA